MTDALALVIIEWEGRSNERGETDRVGSHADGYNGRGVESGRATFDHVGRQCDERMETQENHQVLNRVRHDGGVYQIHKGSVNMEKKYVVEFFIEPGVKTFSKQARVAAGDPQSAINIATLRVFGKRTFLQRDGKALHANNRTVQYGRICRIGEQKGDPITFLSGLFRTEVRS